jgi:hypothetical protein
VILKKGIRRLTVTQRMDRARLVFHSPYVPPRRFGTWGRNRRPEPSTLSKPPRAERMTMSER